MIFGFTGTQKGMTRQQQDRLVALLVDYGFRDGQQDEFHHGDCVGADAEAHDIAEQMGLFLVVHPPLNGSKRAFKKGHIVRAPLTYLCRNREIVRACDMLLAAPFEFHEQLHSGTWSTIRYALKSRRTYVVIRPDGQCLLKEPKGDNQ